MGFGSDWVEVWLPPACPEGWGCGHLPTHDLSSLTCGIESGLVCPAPPGISRDPPKTLLVEMLCWADPRDQDSQILRVQAQVLEIRSRSSRAGQQKRKSEDFSILGRVAVFAWDLIIRTSSVHEDLVGISVQGMTLSKGETGGKEMVLEMGP